MISPFAALMVDLSWHFLSRLRVPGLGFRELGFRDLGLRFWGLGTRVYVGCMGLYGGPSRVIRANIWEYILVW